MNKKVYLCNLEWTKLMKGHKTDGTPDFLGKGGLKATIVFNDMIPYDEYEKIKETNYFNITDEDYKSEENEKNKAIIKGIKKFIKKYSYRNLACNPEVDYYTGWNSALKELEKTIKMLEENIGDKNE